MNHTLKKSKQFIFDELLVATQQATRSTLNQDFINRLVALLNSEGPLKQNISSQLEELCKLLADYTDKDLNKKQNKQQIFIKRLNEYCEKLQLTQNIQSYIMVLQDLMVIDYSLKDQKYGTVLSLEEIQVRRQNQYKEKLILESKLQNITQEITLKIQLLKDQQLNLRDMKKILQQQEELSSQQQQTEESKQNNQNNSIANSFSQAQENQDVQIQMISNQNQIQPLTLIILIEHTDRAEIKKYRASIEQHLRSYIQEIKPEKAIIILFDSKLQTVLKYSPQWKMPIVQKIKGWFGSSPNTDPPNYINTIIKLQFLISKQQYQNVSCLMIGQPSEENISQNPYLKQLSKSIKETTQSFSMYFLGINYECQSFWESFSLLMNGQERDPITQARYEEISGNSQQIQQHMKKFSELIKNRITISQRPMQQHHSARIMEDFKQQQELLLQRAMRSIEVTQVRDEPASINTQTIQQTMISRSKEAIKTEQTKIDKTQDELEDIQDLKHQIERKLQLCTQDVDKLDIEIEQARSNEREFQSNCYLNESARIIQDLIRLMNLFIESKKKQGESIYSIIEAFNQLIKDITEGKELKQIPALKKQIRKAINCVEKRLF